ncbi:MULTISPECIES: hypothetical protein [Bradyrhizobium]|uniref:Arabinose efflux permease family protein n=1 Tax=Bradyrhizobium vignae TaxID=1549949 RepID=A0A2U3PZP1_9BRAD
MALIGLIDGDPAGPIMSGAARVLGATVLACPPLLWLFERIVSVRYRRARS